MNINIQKYILLPSIKQSTYTWKNNISRNIKSFFQEIDQLHIDIDQPVIFLRLNSSDLSFIYAEIWGIPVILPDLFKMYLIPGHIFPPELIIYSYFVNRNPLLINRNSEPFPPSDPVMADDNREYHDWGDTF